MKASRQSDYLYSIGNQVCYALSQWIAVTIIVKTVGLADLGVYSYIIALCAPIFAFSNLGIRTLIVTSQSETEIQTFYSLRYLNSLLSFSILFLYTLVVGGSPIFVAFLIFTQKTVESIDDLYQGILQKNRQFKNIFYANACTLTVSLLMGLFALITTKSLLGYCLILLFGKLIQLLWDMENSRRYPEWQKPNLKEIFNSSIFRKTLLYAPLGISALLTALNSNLPRYLVKHYLGDKSLGLFMGLLFFIIAGANLIVSIKNALTPELTRLWQTSRKSYYRKINLIQALYFLITLIACVFVYFLGDPFLETIYTAEFRGTSTVFIILILSGGFMYMQSLPSLTLTIQRKLNIQPFIAAFSILIGGGLGFLLVPKFELFGAAFAMLGSSFCFFLLTTYFCRD